MVRLNFLLAVVLIFSGLYLVKISYESRRLFAEIENAHGSERQLESGGRLAVISFHSLEDRIVKTFIARESKDEIDRRAPMAPPSTSLRLAALGRIKPGPTEVLTNGRARSAILRVAERL